MMRKFLVVCVALVALFAVEQTQAACKVKSEVGSEATNATNKIQAAPTKRLTNKLLFDVVAKKTDTSDENDEDAEENTDDDE